MTTPGRPPSPAPGSPGGLALAQLADDVAVALASYAQAIRRDVSESPGLPASDPGGAPTATPTRRADVPAAPAPSSGERKLGVRQERCLALVELRTKNGASNAEIAALLGIKLPNASVLTKRLAEMGRLVAVPGEVPARFRRAAE